MDSDFPSSTMMHNPSRVLLPRQDAHPSWGLSDLLLLRLTSTAWWLCESGLPTSEAFTCASQSDLLTVASAVSDPKATDTDSVAIILKATAGRHSTTVVTTSWAFVCVPGKVPTPAPTYRVITTALQSRECYCPYLQVREVKLSDSHKAHNPEFRLPYLLVSCIIRNKAFWRFTKCQAGYYNTSPDHPICHHSA